MFWQSGKVDVRLPGKKNSTSHGARPVHLIITMIKWIRTSRLSIKNSLPPLRSPLCGAGRHLAAMLPREVLGVRLSSEYGTHKIVKARF